MSNNRKQINGDTLWAKILFLLFLPFVAIGADIRTCQGKLFDFTLAQGAGPGSAYSNYWVIGTITEIYPKTFVGIRYLGKRLTVDPQRILYADTSELLGLLALQKSLDSGPMTSGKFLSFSPELRSAIISKDVFEKVALLNYRTNDIAYNSFKCCAVPIGKISLAGISTNISAYDCGSPFSGVFTNRNIYVLSPRAIELRQIATNLLNQQSLTKTP